MNLSFRETKCSNDGAWFRSMKASSVFWVSALFPADCLSSFTCFFSRAFSASILASSLALAPKDKSYWTFFSQTKKRIFAGNIPSLEGECSAVIGRVGDGSIFGFSRAEPTGVCLAEPGGLCRADVAPIRADWGGVLAAFTTRSGALSFSTTRKSEFASS